MWANPTLSYRWLPPPTTTTATNHRPFTVAAKPPRPRKNLNYNPEEEEIAIDKELEALKDQETGDPGVYTSSSDKISGSVVLLALQKASAKKVFKKVSMMKKSKKMSKEEVKDVGVEYGDVKEVCVKSEWKERLDELEREIHQLIHHV